MLGSSGATPRDIGSSAGLAGLAVVLRSGLAGDTRQCSGEGNSHVVLGVVYARHVL